MSGSQQRFVALDGLRGLAALGVVLLHQRAWCAPATAAWLMPRAYLAVDFFLLLSGFVLAHAYADRLATAPQRRSFLLARVVRLHPLIVLAAALGALCLPLYHGQAAIAPGERLLLGLAAAVPLPLPGHPSTVPANFTLWSLIWELILSAAFALLARHATTPRLVAVAVAGMALTLRLARVHDGLDLGGNPQTFAAAGLRLGTDFVLGMLMLRVHRAGRLAGAGPRPWIAVALVASFLPSGAPAVADPLTTLLLYPALLVLAAGAPPRMPEIARAVGAISYPLYVLHGPIVLVLYGIAGDRTASLPDVALVTTALAAIGWAAHRFYDRPVQAWLHRRLARNAVPRRRSLALEA